MENGRLDEVAPPAETDTGLKPFSAVPTDTGRCGSWKRVVLASVEPVDPNDVGREANDKLPGSGEGGGLCNVGPPELGGGPPKPTPVVPVSVEANDCGGTTGCPGVVAPCGGPAKGVKLRPVDADADPTDCGFIGTKGKC